MGEAATRRRQRILEGQRCIYCPNPGETEEHFPPKIMFLNKHRPDRMVFACCADCNRRSRTTDQVASYIARMGADLREGDALFDEWQRLGIDIGRFEPDFIREMAQYVDTVWLRMPSGRIERMHKFEAGGPTFDHHMRVFSLKCAMALYREHMGEALPIGGFAYARYFLNEGIGQDGMALILKTLRGFGTLTQGRLHVAHQFAYRYGINKETNTIAAFIQFHEGLQIVIFASPTEVPFSNPNKFHICSPGSLFTLVD